MVFATLSVVGAAGPVQAEATSADSPDPAALVEHLHERLLAVTRLEAEDGFDARYELLEPVVAKAFDTRLIARLSLGSHWPELTEAEREQFSELIKRYTVSNYAARFDRNSGQRFDLQEVRELREDVRAVRTRFTTGKDKSHRFDYQLRRGDAGWRIVNVAVDGVSDLAVKRAEYSDLYQRQGFDVLARRLRDQIEQFGRAEADA